MARDIIGHESEAVSRNYTHIETETKRVAVDKMPDVTFGLLRSQRRRKAVSGMVRSGATAQ